MARKKCSKCRYAVKAKGVSECSYIAHNPRSKTVQVYEACGVNHPTPETDAMLDPRSCVFFQEGNALRQPIFSVALPGSIPNTGAKKQSKGPIYDWEKGRQLHDEGKSASQIAAALGCSPRAVQEWRRREGLKGSLTGSSFDWERAREMFDRGATIDEIAEALGCSHTSVEGWKRREGLCRQPVDWPRGREMLLAGETAEAVAAALGVKPRTVENFARKEGICWTLATDAPPSK